MGEILNIPEKENILLIYNKTNSK